MTTRPDRRVARSRAALMAAAVDLVAERGAAVPVTDLAEAADVSRQLLYQHFGDRDTLLVAAAADLVRRELLPHLADPRAPRHARLLVVARHFADHRPFYRAVLTGPCAWRLAEALAELFRTLITTEALRANLGEVDEQAARDLAVLISHGTGAIVHDWVVRAEDPLRPEELADRLLTVTSLLTPAPPHP
ncbi:MULTISPECIES: TetR/AcrR family transcriptional regulator [Actinosynnema]|uniref:TetR/AcrR family transcriptional regulator n=1 Tax=Actinosynnema TaxID=40566 RepID=UPI0020A5BD1F|nr:TetR/AcrR family transcriptional regulator [Actinosynnema pretiosum]